MFMGKELNILNSEAFVNEMSKNSQYFDSNLYHEFKQFVKINIANCDDVSQIYPDLFKTIKDGSLKDVEEQLQRLESKNFNRARGLPPFQYELLTCDTYSVIVDTPNWGPLLYSLYSQNYQLFYQLLTKYRFNLSKELLLDPDLDPGENTAGQYLEFLPFYIAIHNRQLEGLHLLLTPNLSHMWKPQFHIKHICNVLNSEGWYDGLQLLIQSKTMSQYFLSINCQEMKQDMIRAMHLSLIDDIDKHEEMLRINLLLTSPVYALHFMLYLLTNYDFLQSSIQKDLFLFAKQCNENMRKKDIQIWMREQQRQASSLVIVKEFMIVALDQNNLIQRNLRQEFEYFFQLVRGTPGYSEIEEEQDIDNQSKLSQLSNQMSNIKQFSTITPVNRRISYFDNIYSR